MRDKGEILCSRLEIIFDAQQSKKARSNWSCSIKKTKKFKSSKLLGKVRKMFGNIRMTTRQQLKIFGKSSKILTLKFVFLICFIIVARYKFVLSAKQFHSGRNWLWSSPTDFDESLVGQKYWMITCNQPYWCKNLGKVSKAGYFHLNLKCIA